MDSNNENEARGPAAGDDDAITPTINIEPENGMPLAEAGILPIGSALGASPMGGSAAMGLGAAGMPVGVPLPIGVSPGGSSDAADEHMADRAETALAEDGRLGSEVARNIRVSFAEEVILLTGHVPSTGEREIAEQICAHVTGARRIDNRLTIGA